MATRKRTKTANTGARSAVVASAEPRANADEANLHLGRFFVRYLQNLSREFDGDLQLAILVGEIGHHNVCRHYAFEAMTVRRSGRGKSTPGFWADLEPCNAYSLAAATGIPRETVRRKISTLVRRGWITRTERGDLFITPALVAHFVPNFNKNLMNEILALADELRSILSGRVGVDPQSPAARTLGQVPAIDARPRGAGGASAPKARTTGTRRGGHGRPRG